MLQLYSWIHSIFKDLSNDTSHAQIRFKRRSYVINKLEKKTSPLADVVATKPVTRLSYDKTQILLHQS